MKYRRMMALVLAAVLMCHGPVSAEQADELFEYEAADSDESAGYEATDSDESAGYEAADPDEPAGYEETDLAEESGEDEEICLPEEDADEFLIEDGEMPEDEILIEPDGSPEDEASDCDELVAEAGTVNAAGSTGHIAGDMELSFYQDSCLVVNDRYRDVITASQLELSGINEEELFERDCRILSDVVDTLASSEDALPDTSMDISDDEMIVEEHSLETALPKAESGTGTEEEAEAEEIVELTLQEAENVLAGKGFTSSFDVAGAQVRNCMKSRTKEFDINIASTVPDMHMLDDVIMEKAVMHTGVSTEGDYLLYQYGGYKLHGSYACYNSIWFFRLHYTMAYYTTAAQERQMDADMAALLGSLTCVNGTVYERICEVYQYVCSNVTYDNAHSSSYSLKYSAYAALHNRTAVCQGYAVLLYRILLELGIDVRVIGGFGYSEPHAWNIIRIGDYYYNVDATWDSASSSGAYQCFLKCRATFKNHSRDAEYETDEFLREYPVNSKDYSSYSCVSGGQHTRSSSRRSVPATCTKNGYAASYYCSVCGQGLEMAKIIPATGHRFGSWKTVKAATVFDTGYRKHTCSSCGEVEYEYQEKLKSKAGLNVTGTLPMKVGQSTKKVKIVSKANGDYVSSWSSSKPSVVFVSRTGKLKARRKGKATITVKMAGGAKASFKVKVTKKKVKTKSISLPSKALTLKKGKTFSLKAVLTPLTSQQKLKYKSSNKKVVKVSSKGKLTALRRGTAVITVRSGSKKIRCTVKVA